jgi:ParB-like chromosome segregation protein Spo0J
MADKHETTSTGLVEQVKTLFVKSLQNGSWRPAKELEALITDEMAQARCETVHPLAIADLSDPKEYARLLLTNDALRALEASDTCEVRGAEGKQEVRLVGPDGVAEFAAPPAATAANWDKSDVSVVQTATRTDAQNGGEAAPVTTGTETAPDAPTPPLQAPTADTANSCTTVVQGKTSPVASLGSILPPKGRDRGNGHKKPQEPVEKTVPIRLIRVDPALQTRTRIDPVVVVEYAEEMGRSTFPPLRVVFDGKVYWLVDGFHRLAALKKRKAKTVTVLVIMGTRDDALWLAVSANKEHLSLRRTNADKQRAVKLALEHRNAKGLSDHAIAAHVGVTSQTVGSYRKRLSNSDSQPACRTGRDGRSIDTSNIGKKRGAGRQQLLTSATTETAALNKVEVPAAGPAQDERIVSSAVGMTGLESVADAAPDGDIEGTDTETAATEEVKKQEAEGERFQRFLHALAELEAAWKLDKGGFVTQARKLTQKERARLKALLDNHAARGKKLSKAIGA